MAEKKTNEEFKEIKETNESGKESFVKLKKNQWMVSTFVLAGICIVLLVLMFGVGKITGKVISEEDATEKLVGFLNAKTGGGISLVDSEDSGNFYKVTLGYEGSKIPVYLTKDGNYYTLQLVQLSGQAIQDQQQPTQQQTQVQKSDKPKVEAFVFSYCPYGLQFEKALLPVYKILKNKADINLVAIGAMHGEYEKQESLRQLCIQKNYGKDKLWEYLERFMGDTAIGDCKDKIECSKPLVEKIMSQVGIDKYKIEACVKSDAEALYNADMQRAKELGISGSPGFVINGAEVQVARSPDAIKKAVCSAFNQEPSECSQTVSSEAATPWFGFSASTGETPNSHASGSC